MKNAPPESSSDAASGSRSPLGFLQSLLGSVRPPDWVVDELQNRVVLFLNHVLMQEPQAQERLKRHEGKPVKVQWGDFHLTLAPTPAGLLERPSADAKPELTVTLTQASPFALAQSVIAGDKPGVDIQGDVQLAAEVAWLVDNVRWDVEEDLSRMVGDATAHTLGKFARTASQAVKAFVARLPAGFPPRPAAAPAAPADGAGTQGSGGTPA
jgi:ubiquinone biosynthesis protein UbiJ